MSTGVEIEVQGCVDCPFYVGDDMSTGCVAPEGPNELPNPPPRTFPEGCPLPVLVGRKP